MIAPILDGIADEYKGKIRVAKLNIDENPNTPPKYGIRGIPTLMLFKNGEVEATKVGAVSKSGGLRRAQPLDRRSWCSGAHSSCAAGSGRP
jgi:thiol-disulfide isomerase/thioredoxin